MPDKPNAAALLEEARRTLLEALLPLLPPDRRYDGLMVANAMAIAAREAGQEDVARREAVSRLSSLLQVPSTALSDPDLPVRLLGLERRLADEIRAGLHDSASARR